MEIDPDNLAEQALMLPMEQRVALAHRLLSSGDMDADPEAEAAWEEEIIRRIAQFDAGEVSSIPAADVFARLREIAPGSP